MKLLSESNAKIAKTNGKKTGHKMAVMHLSPSDSSGHGNTCGAESIGCKKSCFRNSGFFMFPQVQTAHDERTRLFYEDRDTFLAVLMGECGLFRWNAEGENRKAVIRLNGTSDLRWEELFPSLFTLVPAQYHDYTKHFDRMERFLDAAPSVPWPENYYLTFSRSENNSKYCLQVLGMGGNVAVVFRKKPFPERFWDYPVIDGDTHDLRFLDPSPCIVGLSAKGRARTDETGFTVDV